MSNRIIYFDTSEEKALMKTICSPNIKVTTVELIGGENVSLIALNDAIEQLERIYPIFEWEFTKVDKTVLPPFKLIAKLLPILVS